MNKIILLEMLQKYISELPEITDNSLQNAVMHNNHFVSCVANFFTPEHLATINVLYGESLWMFKNYMKNYNNLCTPYIEGKQPSDIIWPEFTYTYSIDCISFNYLVFNDNLDPLYELLIIEKHLNMTFKNISIKCIIDNRTSSFSKDGKYSIESRANIIPESVLVIPKIKNCAKS